MAEAAAGLFQGPGVAAPITSPPQHVADRVMIQFDSSHMLSYLKTRKKGTAGGCDGWTYDLILSVYNACQGTAFPGLWDDFAAVLCLLANNMIPDSVRSLATDTRCIGLLENRHGALEKLRLLGLPSALVNLMQGAVAAKYKDRLLEVAASLGNLACSVPAGTEVYAAIARTFLAKHRSGVFSCSTRRTLSALLAASASYRAFASLDASSSSQSLSYCIATLPTSSSPRPTEK
jgi:hypothetical protein